MVINQKKTKKLEKNKELPSFKERKEGGDAKAKKEGADKKLSPTASSLKKIEKATHEVTYQFSDFIYAGIVCLIIFMAMKLVNKYLWKTYEKKYGKPAPQFLMTFLNICAIFITAAFISVVIFERSLFSLLTAGGVAALGVSFALQGPILDFFSGINMDIEGRVSNGDWVRLQDGSIGQIIGHNWRSVILVTMDNTELAVPNSKFIQSQYENISAKGEFWQTIKISLDHNISVKRARRIIESAISETGGVHKANIGAFADSLAEGGINYNCRYMILDFANSPKIRHDVIENIIARLHYYKLGVSETLGEYVISMRNEQEPSWKKLEGNEHAKEVLEKTPIIKDLGKVNLKTILIKSKIKTFEVGEDVCVQGDQGDTMYIILEGFVDIIVHDAKTQKGIFVATLKAADYFGEMALFMGDKRRSTVRARTSLITLEIARSVIIPIISKNPKILDTITHTIAKHLESNQQFIEDLQEKEPDPKPPIIKTIYKHILKILSD